MTFNSVFLFKSLDCIVYILKPYQLHLFITIYRICYTFILNMAIPCLNCDTLYRKLVSYKEQMYVSHGVCCTPEISLYVIYI